MTFTSTLWRIPPWAAVPIALAIFAEATSNALRAYGVGMALEKFTIHVSDWTISLSGAVLVIGSVAMSLTQSAAGWQTLKPGTPWQQRIVSCLVMLLCAGISITAYRSNIHDARAIMATDTTNEGAAYLRAEAAYTAAKAELDALGTGFTTDEIRAQMDKVAVPARVYNDTTQCTKGGMTPDERKACRPLLDLREAMATAIKREDLQTRVDVTREELSKLKKPDTDVVREDDLQETLAWLFGLGVVLVATFGAAVFARVEAGTAPADAEVAPPALPHDNDDLPRLPKGGSRVFRKEEALADLLTMTAMGHAIESQDWLKQRWGLGSKGTVSKWLGEWEAQGLISRPAFGRYKSVESA